MENNLLIVRLTKCHCGLKRHWSPFTVSLGKSSDDSFFCRKASGLTLPSVRNTSKRHIFALSALNSLKLPRSNITSLYQYLLKRLNSHLLSATLLTFDDLRKKRFLWRGSFKTKANSHHVLSLSYHRSLFLLSLLLKTVISSADSWAHALLFFKQPATTESFTSHLIITPI